MGSPETSVVGAILAGGESRRLGKDKALLPLSGRPLILHPFEVLKEVMNDVIAVSVPGRGYEDLGIPVVHDRFEGQGPLAGIHAALEWASPRPVFVVACDLPFISPELVAHVGGWGGREDNSVPLGRKTTGRPRARVAVWGGRQQPLCGLYSTECHRALERRLGAGKLEVWRFVEAIEATPVPITPALDFYRPDLLINVNSLQDLKQTSRDQALEPAELP